MWSELPNGELPGDYYSGVKIFCSPVPISVDDLGASEFVEPPFLIIHEQVRELASSFCLEKFWSTRDSVYKIQEQGNFCGHHVLEHATVCSTDKLITLEQFTDKNSYELKPGLHPLCMSTSRALMVLMFDWPLSSERERAYCWGHGYKY